MTTQSQQQVEDDTIGLSLALGVFLSLLITGVQRVVPEIRRQMREAEAKRV